MGRRREVDYDSSEYRKKLWEIEYSQAKGLLSSKTIRPSSSLRRFLEMYTPQKGLAVDIGSGNGRNCIYLKQQGFEKVIGIELSSFACKQAEDMLKSENISGIEIFNQNLALGIPTENCTCDLVIDMMSMHAMSITERSVTNNEIQRVLKPGGYFLFFTLAKNSPAAKDLIDKWPGSEDGSYRYNVDGKVHTEKTFTKEEILEDLKNMEEVYWEETAHDTPAFGKVYSRVYIMGIMKKK